MRRHTDRTFDAELLALRQRLGLMAARVEEMIARAVGALLAGDVALARETIELDELVDRDEVELDRASMRLLARWQPMASDLRFIAVVLKTVTDLERVGDLSVGICKEVLGLETVHHGSIPPMVPEMARVVQGMIREAVSAFLAGDPALAEQVMRTDDRVDEMHREMLRQLLESSAQGGPQGERALRIHAVAANLERMGDHATNLAEQVIFMVKGRDVRHRPWP